MKNKDGHNLQTDVPPETEDQKKGTSLPEATPETKASQGWRRNCDL